MTLLERAYETGYYQGIDDLAAKVAHIIYMHEFDMPLTDVIDFLEAEVGYHYDAESLMERTDDDG